MLLEFYNSLDTIFQVTIILWLLAIILKWGGGVIISIVTLVLTAIHTRLGLLVGGLVTISAAVFVIALVVCTIWSCFKLLFTLL